MGLHSKVVVEKVNRAGTKHVLGLRGNLDTFDRVNASKGPIDHLWVESSGVSDVNCRLQAQGREK